MLPLAGACTVTIDGETLRARGPRERVLRGHRLRLRADARARGDRSGERPLRASRRGAPTPLRRRATAPPRTCRWSCAAPATRRARSTTSPPPRPSSATADRRRGAHARRQLVLVPAAQARRGHPGVETRSRRSTTSRSPRGGFAYQRVVRRAWTLLAEVRSGDAIHMPRGYHGPSMAAPGYDLYYLNVMAGRASASGTSSMTPTTPGSATPGRTRSWTRDCR